MPEDKESFDFGIFAKNMIYAGFILIGVMFLLLFVASLFNNGLSWEDEWFIPRGVMAVFPGISFFLILFGVVSYVIHGQFVELAKIAEEFEGEE